MEGLKLGLVKFFREVLIPKFGKRDRDLPITPTDITSGLCGMVWVRLSKPEFSAQHKAKLYTPIVYNMKTTSPELVILEGQTI